MKKSLSLLKRFYPLMIGAIGGYAYYYFIGCASGACPISSNPWVSTFYGTLMGSAFVFGNRSNKKHEE
jgi:hypothetical protein